MGNTYIGTVKAKVYIGSAKVRKIYVGNTQVYSSGSIVTYNVDSGVVYTEEVDEGVSCLSPASFTPAKSGWTFVGWREDATASESVLSSKVMGDNPITLYAVYRRTVTLSYAGNGHTGGATASQSQYRYYNCGNYANPTFILSENGFTRAGHNFTGWDIGGVGSAVTLSVSTTATAQWKIAANPYTVSLNPSDWTLTYETATDNRNLRLDSYHGLDFYIVKNEDASGIAFTNYSATFATRGCSRCKLTFNWYGGASASINGVGVVTGYQGFVNGNTITLNCSGDAFTISANINTNTEGHFYIGPIEFLE